MTPTSSKSRFLITACIVSVLLAAGRPEAQRKGEAGMSAATHRELATARSATARYHDLAQAEADGYANANLYISNEGFHWLNASLIDDVFDPARPEVLLYAEVPGEKRLQLVAVEYIVPLSAGRPAGFTGPADRWREDAEGAGLWELTVWLWGHNPMGLFSHLNPIVP